MSDESELNEIIEHAPAMPTDRSPSYRSVGAYGNTNGLGELLESWAVDCEEQDEREPRKEKKGVGEIQQWSTSDGKMFVPVATCQPVLKPGLYEIGMSQQVGLYFEKLGLNISNLMQFPDSKSEEAIENIKTFWDKEALFKKHQQPFKRGVLLWGPPGSGKTSTSKIIIKDVIDRNGVVFKFTHPDVFLKGLRTFRTIQPNTPVVVLMEDIDSIIMTYDESSVINMLDGIDVIDKVVFLATTNYPEKLGSRIINRPSRFDCRFKISSPNEESRKMYLTPLVKEYIEDTELETWVEDTEGMSIAHLKELFIGVCVLGDEYTVVIERLKAMSEIPSSSDDDADGEGKAGFGFDISND